MEMTSARAMLVDAGVLDTSQAVTATVPRDQIEAVLATDEPAELILDVVRPGAVDQAATVSVAWERPDLERLLIGTSSDAVTFAFSSAELERALEDPEFEGHGMRERAAVLTVAAMAAAGVSAAQASAKPMEVSGQASGAAITAVAAPHDEMGLDQRGIVTAAAVHDEIPLAARGIATTPSHDEATLAARGITSQPAPAVHDELPLAARGIESTPVHDETTLTARGIEIDPTAVHDEATLVQRGIETPAPADDGSGFTMPSVDPGAAAAVGGAVGGAALLIAAAAFAARRRPPVRPA
jgi:hypothetical protein